MKRHNPKTIRQGRSLWYASLDWRFEQWAVGRIMVGSDNLPDPEEGVMYDVLPRRYILKAMAVNGYFDHQTRRSAQRECDRLNRKYKRLHP